MPFIRSIFEVRVAKLFFYPALPASFTSPLLVISPISLELTCGSIIMMVY